MTKHESTIALIRIAGYHDDKASWTRLYIENRVSYPKASAAFSEGQQARKNGTLCNCYECRKGSQ